MPTTKVGDTSIYYEVHGKGEPLLLIIGYGFYSGHWLPAVDYLSQEYSMIIFDNRGTGRSDKPDVPYTMKMMADDTVGVLDAVGVDAAHVFGVSMGGMIAQHYALDYPHRLQSLVLGCTSCGGTRAVPPTEEALTVLFDPGRAKLSEEQRAKETPQWLWTQGFIDKNPAIVKQFVATTLEYPTPPHAYTCQGAAMMGHDTYDRLPQIKAPTLVIAGDSDRLIPYENSKILASRLPNAELVILKNSGHGFITDAAEDAKRTILGFLRRHSKVRK